MLLYTKNIQQNHLLQNILLRNESCHYRCHCTASHWQYLWRTLLLQIYFLPMSPSFIFSQFLLGLAISRICDHMEDWWAPGVQRRARTIIQVQLKKRMHAWETQIRRASGSSGRIETSCARVKSYPAQCLGPPEAPGNKYPQVPDTEGTGFSQK